MKREARCESGTIPVAVSLINQPSFMPLLKIFNGKAMVVSESEDLPISYSFIHAFGRKAEDKVDSFYFHGTIVPIPLTAQKNKSS
jgi:hypothetical protein